MSKRNLSLLRSLTKSQINKQIDHLFLHGGTWHLPLSATEPTVNDRNWEHSTTPRWSPAVFDATTEETERLQLRTLRSEEQPRGIAWLSLNKINHILPEKLFHYIGSENLHVLSFGICSSRPISTSRAFFFVNFNKFIIKTHGVEPWFSIWSPGKGILKGSVKHRNWVGDILDFIIKVGSITINAFIPISTVNPKSTWSYEWIKTKQKNSLLK